MSFDTRTSSTPRIGRRSKRWSASCSQLCVALAGIRRRWLAAGTILGTLVTPIPPLAVNDRSCLACQERGSHGIVEFVGDMEDTGLIAAYLSHAATTTRDGTDLRGTRTAAALLRGSQAASRAAHACRRTRGCHP